MNLHFRNWDIHVGDPHPFNAERPRPDNGTARPDPARYYSREFWQAEWDRMFTRTWLLAGVVSDIPDTGDWFRFEIGSESFIVVRREDGGADAFYNVCPHRGSQLVLGEFGGASQFVCPFHSWTFGLDGKNKRVTDAHTFHPDVLCHGTDLKQVRCEIAAGLVFVSMKWPTISSSTISSRCMSCSTSGRTGEPTGKAVSMPSTKSTTCMRFIRRPSA
jgi:carnitine monooxygenase subunit